MTVVQIRDNTDKQTGLFSLQTEKIDPAEFSRDPIRSGTGSRVEFQGLVRDNHRGRQVLSLEYSAYEELCKAEGGRMLRETLKLFDIQAVYVVHRYGVIPIGDCALWVEIHSTHRRDGFSACQYVIDEIKNRLPVWKYETYGDGTSEWGCYAGA